MKLTSKRALLCSTAAVSLAALIGCGDSSSNPDAVSLEDLNSPKSLQILDEGDGTITLHWSANNNKDDFDGYNIYGGKVGADKGLTAADAESLAGTPLNLLDADGNKVAASLQTLYKMSYDGEAFTPVADAGEDTKYYPIHKKPAAADAEPVLPTCAPEKVTNSACKLTEAEREATTFNGKTEYQITGLTAGDTYCFAVFATLDGGEEISASSSPVRCVTLRAKATISLDLSTVAKKSFSRSDYETLVDRTDFCSATKVPDEEICIEFSGGKLGITSTAKALVLDAGYNTSGFESLDIRGILSASADDFTDANKVRKTNGYSNHYMTFALEQNHVYFVATLAEDEETIFYDYYWVESLSHTNKTATIQVRKAVNAK